MHMCIHTAQTHLNSIYLDAEVISLDIYRQLLFDNDIPFSHNVHTVHFFPHGGERGQEDKLKVSYV